MGERKEVSTINSFRIERTDESEQVFLLINNQTEEKDWIRLEECFLSDAVRQLYWDYGGDKSTASGWGKFADNAVYHYVPKGKTSGQFQPELAFVFKEASEDAGDGKRRLRRQKRKASATPSEKPKDAEEESSTAPAAVKRPSGSPALKKAKSQEQVRMQ